MEKQDPRAAVSRLVAVLRKTTRLVKIIPFAYLVVYAAVLLTESFLPDGLYSVINALLNVPPAVVLLFLMLSHILKLCIWHKAACLIPMLPRIMSLFDEFVMTLSREEVISINIILGVSTLFFILIAYNHIFHGLKRTNQGNA